MSHNILITGGCGFIGSNLIRFFINKYTDYKIYNIDSLTYASNSKNLIDIENKKNYNFIKADITNYNFIKEIFSEFRISKVIHLAAESHVDNSINNPGIFANTNIVGTLNLLQIAKEVWSDNYADNLFYHISTDEVYGSLQYEGCFNENSSYNPRSPYAASKASSDHFVRAFGHTYGLPIIVSNCSNNYGPFQFREKLIPLTINNIIEQKPIPVYGNGKNIRDWLHVDDHVSAIDTVFHNGSINETYNIGGSNELENIDLINMIVDISDRLLSRDKGFSKKFITFVKDRPGHDFRYAIDTSKIKRELGWMPIIDFKNGLEKTINWFISNHFNN